MSKQDEVVVGPGRPYTGPRAWPAEGARVALVSCKRCGAALLLDPADEVNVVKLHDEWHDLLMAFGVPNEW